MKYPRLILSLSAGIAAPLACAIALAQNSAPVPALLQPPATLPSTLPAVGESVEQIPLGHAFENLSAGISFKPPVDCKVIDMDAANSRYIAEWADPARDWTLKLGRMTLDKSTPLVTMKSEFGNGVVEGLLDRTVKNLTTSLPGSKIVRQDVSNTRDGGTYNAHHPEWRNNVGLIAIRYTNEGKRKLSQQAIIHASDSVYYLITLTTPGASFIAQNAGQDDPAEQVAADVFSRMVDSVRLLDRTAIKQDQDNRLYNTRSAFVNWTPVKLHAVLINEQWVRIIKDGKDVGYSYITEDQAGGIPRPLTQKEIAGGIKELDLVKGKPGDGVLIGVRARLLTEGMRSDKTVGPLQTDSSSWFFVSADKKHEDFSRVVVTDDYKSPKKGYVQEFGVSEKRIRRMFEKPVPNANGVVVPDKAPVPVMKEDWELDVTQTSNVGMAPMLERKLPPWYIPQALTHMLPRLIPVQKPRSYLFANYISEAREVVMRYVDVLPEQMVSFTGQMMRAIPVQDRLGLEGSITTHYISLDGVYLGSENKEQKLVMLPTDSGTLQQIWKDANLTRPGGVQKPGPANVDAVTPGR